MMKVVIFMNRLPTNSKHISQTVALEPYLLLSLSSKVGDQLEDYEDIFLDLLIFCCVPHCCISALNKYNFYVL